jgi:hypothetical protein
VLFPFESLRLAPTIPKNRQEYACCPTPLRVFFLLEITEDDELFVGLLLFAEELPEFRRLSNSDLSRDQHPGFAATARYFKRKSLVEIASAGLVSSLTFAITQSRTPFSVQASYGRPQYLDVG